jgi:hypothetical protein
MKAKEIENELSQIKKMIYGLCEELLIKSNLHPIPPQLH